MSGHSPEQHALQWGGRFASEPDPTLLDYGRSLGEDVWIAHWDVLTSKAHVLALQDGGVISVAEAALLIETLDAVDEEIRTGAFFDWALARSFEDIHGAIDARVRELAGPVGDRLHSGRSRNDQVATTMLLFVRDLALDGATRCLNVAAQCSGRALEELERGTLLAATTHWQPAQPVLLALWIDAVARGFVRAAKRFERVYRDTSHGCPLGSAAVAGSSLPLGREEAARALHFGAPSENALDAVGDRDVLLDFLNACMRAVVFASRPSEELVLWATPAFGYVRVGDAASTGSSLMPQKRNPDPFELIRGTAGAMIGAYAGAVATVKGVALSYHRDLQQTKKIVIDAGRSALASIEAFEHAFADVEFERETMTARAGDGFTVATDLADALILGGASARDAHRAVGERVLLAETEGRRLDAGDVARLGLEAAPLDPAASVRAKRTSGSTHPDQVRNAIASTRATIARIAASFPDLEEARP